MIESVLPVKRSNQPRTVRPVKTDQPVTHEVRPAPRAMRNLDWDLLWEKFGIATVLVVVWILAALATPRFANLDNLASVLRQSAFVGVAAVGMTIAIIAGTFDLSVGSTQALSAWTAVSIAAHFGVLPAFVAAIAVGGIVGWLNGLIGNIPVPFILFLFCASIGAITLHRTSFGRYVFAIGSNVRAAHVAGVPVNRTIFLVFVVVGLFTGLGAALLGSRLYSAGPGLEPGFELNVIATVVLGGTRLAGGRG